MITKEDLENKIKECEGKVELLISERGELIKKADEAVNEQLKWRDFYTTALKMIEADNG
jgi:hypothetical protein